MQKWKKKLVVSQIALACTMAIASQANAKDISGTTYNTFGYDGTAASTLYNGYTDWNNASAAVDGDIYPVINKSVVNGVISGYYLDDAVGGKPGLRLVRKDRYGHVIENITEQPPVPAAT
jgi:hypothetical protein